MEDLTGVERLRAIVARLRGPGGCPWDIEQTHGSLGPFVVEESYELIDAIESADDANLREELGDLLLHVVMHSCIAEERGVFAFEEVAETVCEKMIRRHPHVFGDGKAEGVQEVLGQWERIKREEKGVSQQSRLDGVAAALPALMKAQTVQKKAARVGFDWPDVEPVYAKIVEETQEVREAIAAGERAGIEAELGDLLFSVVNLARKLGVDAETALAGSTKRFVGRFQQIERTLDREGRRMEETELEELDRIWEQAK